MKLIVLASVLSAASADCDARHCVLWDCEKGCSCYESADEPVYEQVGCIEDGESCDCSAVKTTPHWHKLMEGDAKGYCNNFDGTFAHGESKQHNKYTTNLFNKSSQHDDGRFDPNEVTEMVEECKKRCDREEEFTCISFSVSIAHTTLWCKGSPNVPTMTTTKQDAECWRKF